MLSINKDKLTKAIIMIASGLLIAFFPGVINKLFYITGVLVIAVSVITLVIKLVTGNGILSSVNNIVGIIAGALIIWFPSLITVGIPLIAGIMTGFSGIDRIFRSIENGLDKKSLIMGIICVIAGGILVFYNNDVSNTMRIIIGLVLVGMGIFNLFIKESGKNTSSDNIIDVDDYKIS